MRPVLAVLRLGLALLLCALVALSLWHEGGRPDRAAQQHQAEQSALRRAASLAQRSGLTP